ncbi:MAG TPA: DUF1015 family protein [Methanospirillum sp.]|nr:DUF1015 family protein [Methanospirillum sp.]
MVKIYPFAAVRPAEGRAQDIAAVPYDVVSAGEARGIITEQPLSFLRISRADALIPDGDPYADEVYQLSRTLFDEYLSSGLFFKESVPAFYVYRVIHDGRSYTGLACCIDTREYEQGIIRRHELTRYDKEEDRTRHIDTVNANTGPVVLLHHKSCGVAAVLNEAYSIGSPLMEVTAANGSVHQMYGISDPNRISQLMNFFSSMPALYIADGHHRCKSAVNIIERRKARGMAVPEETYHVMGVIFAEDEVKVHGYSRLLTTLEEFTPATFLDALRGVATVTPYGSVDVTLYTLPCKGQGQDHIFHLYLKGVWYECTIPRSRSNSRIDALDVSVLQEKVLIPLLNIVDSRADPRLQYLGGARPVRDLMEKVDSGEYAAAIAMQPVDVQTVCEIADEGGIMPPKSTWFEPKLLSGLLVHQLE